MPITAPKPLGNVTGNTVDFTEQSTCEHPSGEVTIIVTNSAGDNTFAFSVDCGIGPTNSSVVYLPSGGASSGRATHRVPWAPFIRVRTESAAASGTNQVTLIY